MQVKKFPFGSLEYSVFFFPFQWSFRLWSRPNLELVLKVAAKKLTLKNVTDYIVDVVIKRSKLGYNYGVILIPEGLIDFIPEVLLLLLKLIMSVSLALYS